MNRNVLVEELKNIGIIVLSFEFGQAGYVLELKLNPDKAPGWEELEHLPIVGLELAKNRPTGAYTRKVLYIPGNSKEFKDYVNRHMKYYGLGKEKALSDLEMSIEKFGNKYTKICLQSYLNRIRK